MHLFIFDVDHFSEKAMAPHSSTLAWKIPWTEEPGGLQSMGSPESDMTEWLHFTFHFLALEKEMATHSSVLAWSIPGTGKPGGLLSMGWHRVRHDWSDLAVAAAAGPFVKAFIEFVTILLLLSALFCWSRRGMWDLSFPARNGTHTPALESEVLTPGPPGEVLELLQA